MTPTVPLNLQQTTEPTEIATLSHLGQSSIDAMSYAELNDFVDRGVNHISLNLVNIREARKALLPAIQRIHVALSHQGRRNDLPDAPKELTFDAWVKSKENLFGSRATLYRLLAAQAGISQKRLPVGTKVRDIGSGEVGTVERTYTEGDEPKVDVQFGKEDKTPFSAENLERVPIREVKLGDLFILTDLDDGYLYSYEGNHKLARAEKIQKPQKTAKPKPKVRSTSASALKKDRKDPVENPIR